jgi:streptothricin acetyltransferase
MTRAFDILPLTKLNLAEIRAIVTGYESNEKYAVEKHETDTETIFRLRLVGLEIPHRNTFEQDFTADEIQRFTEFLTQGYSYAVYVKGKVIAFAICEAQPWNRSLMIWEFHVGQHYQRQGIGRALMERVVARAAQDKFRIVSLETQNTNVGAIRFYRSLGFSLEALDLALYTNHDVEDGEVAFFMKRKLNS